MEIGCEVVMRLELISVNNRRGEMIDKKASEFVLHIWAVRPA